MEQWICSRIHPSFVITTYTGLEQHSIIAGILSVPTDEDEWSPRLRVWFKALAKFHARRKDTPLGALMVTNLSGFPSALTVIPVPEGDIRKHREDFIVNENLKRMGCSGRAGLNLAPPSNATQAKFYQLYHASDRIPLYGAVIELVKLCQVALVLYGKLSPEYADGLLCDVTEQAINNWWADLGTEYFNVDPTDGILGPTTVSAMLGILLGARNRLHAYGAPVAKDVFDVVSTKRGIAYFQKSQKNLERSRRLDRKTLDRLHRATAKAASGEGWTMPRAVKTTVAELSGKGGDMVTGRAGVREKAGIADVETLDIETFISLVSGERSKWLWYGKPRKSGSSSFNNLYGNESLTFTKDENGNYTWTSQKRDSAVDDHQIRGLSSRIYSHPSHGSQASMESPDKDQALRRNVLKSVSGRVTDARTGLGRIKDVVGISGIRGHHHKYSKEDNVPSDGDSFKERPSWRSKDQTSAPTGDTRYAIGGEDAMSIDEGSGETSPTSPAATDHFDKPYKQEPRLDIVRNSSPSREDAGSTTSSGEVAPDLPMQKSSRAPLECVDHQFALDPDATFARMSSDFARNQTWDDKAIRKASDLPAVLRKTKSFSTPVGSIFRGNRQNRLPRHLSFSTFLDVVASEDRSRFADGSEVDTSQDSSQALLLEENLTDKAQTLAQSLEMLSLVDGPSVEHKVDDVQALDKQASQDNQIIEEMYHMKLEEYNNLRDATDDLLSEEKAALTDSLKDMETLGAKLEYELNALQSKVEDMESGVADFERQVEQLENRAEELGEEKQESWFQWAMALFTGEVKASA